MNEDVGLGIEVYPMMGLGQPAQLAIGVRCTRCGEETVLHNRRTLLEVNAAALHLIETCRGRPVLSPMTAAAVGLPAGIVDAHLPSPPAQAGEQ